MFLCSCSGRPAGQPCDPGQVLGSPLRQMQAAHMPKAFKVPGLAAHRLRCRLPTRKTAESPHLGPDSSSATRPYVPEP